jgi:hypothetical protein
MKYPFTLTEANLKTAMADPRYANSRHPDSQSWRGMVSQGFATLYPDQTLRGDHTDQLERHQGADGHIYASDGTKVAQGGAGGGSSDQPRDWHGRWTSGDGEGGGGGGEKQAGSRTPLPSPTNRPVDVQDMHDSWATTPMAPVIGGI